jgi:acetyl-CoA/propionyl-CoA carboxylase biotin carboxyl carrier protein
LLHTPEPIYKRHRVKQNTLGGASGDGLVSPMQGTVVKIHKSNGDRVAVGDLIVVLEAMKMEQPLVAHKDGTITNMHLNVGQTVASGVQLCVIED